MEGTTVPTLSKIEYIRKRVRELALSPAWHGQIDLETVEDREVEIRVRNRFVRDWIQDNYLAVFEKDLKELQGEDLSIRVVVTQADARSEEREEVRPVEKPQARSLFHDSLKPKYSFGSFVVGNSNQFAHAGARAVAQQPGKTYNPLFVYGGVGLGKTHLLNAIGLEALKNHPTLRVAYVSAEKFMNEMIHCLRFEKMVDFRKKYRDGSDLLLVDDIQFIAGKERTQEEFFHTFNHLHDAQRQIVLTSDKPPRDIPDLEQRLRSRFEWGLIADIQVPDLETRMAIIRKKAEEDEIKIDDEVTLFLATHIKSNVRELEGALIRLNAFATLNGIPLSVSLAREVLKKVLGSLDRALTVEHVQKVVSDFYGLRVSDLIGKRRVKSLALPRQIAMYLCRKHIKSSYPEIGTKFGGKDHSTVVHAFSKIDRVLESDPNLREQVYTLEQKIIQ